MAARAAYDEFDEDDDGLVSVDDLISASGRLNLNLAADSLRCFHSCLVDQAQQAGRSLEKGWNEEVGEREAGRREAVGGLDRPGVSGLTLRSAWSTLLSNAAASEVKTGDEQEASADGMTLDSNVGYGTCRRGEGDESVWQNGGEEGGERKRDLVCPEGRLVGGDERGPVHVEIIH